MTAFAFREARLRQARCSVLCGFTGPQGQSWSIVCRTSGCLWSFEMEQCDQMASLSGPAGLLYRLPQGNSGSSPPCPNSLGRALISHQKMLMWAQPARSSIYFLASWQSWWSSMKAQMTSDHDAVRAGQSLSGPLSWHWTYALKRGGTLSALSKRALAEM